jgi:hypothetical protein
MVRRGGPATAGPPAIRALVPGPPPPALDLVPAQHAESVPVTAGAARPDAGAARREARAGKVVT